MPKVTSQEFLRAFSQVWGTTRQPIDTSIASPHSSSVRVPDWTAFILDHVLKEVLLRLKVSRPDIEYKREIYTIDALIVGGKNLYGSDLYYPSELLVLIEHEMGSNVEEEMWKLIHWRSPLKIVMLYDWASDEKRNSKNALWPEEKLKRLAYMLASVNAFHPEAADTEYVFVIGNRDKADGPITWTFATPSVLTPAPLP